MYNLHKTDPPPTSGQPLLDDGEAEGEAEGEGLLLQLVLRHKLGQTVGNVVEQGVPRAHHQPLRDGEDLGLHHKVALTFQGRKL